MAKKKKEEIVEKTINEPKGDVTKVKEKMKKPAEVVGETMIKVDLSKPPKTETDAVQEPEANASNAIVGESKDSESSEKVVEEVRDTKEEPIQDETPPVIEEITSEQTAIKDTKEVEEKIEEVVKVAEKTGEDLPEEIQKLVNFMNETGGDINDYVTLNQDYSEMDNQTLLKEYYKQTKSHLNDEEINFLMEDQFSYDEEVDEEREIRRKKLALKEQVASAKGHLDDLKSKYYEDIKAGSKLTTEQQKAVDFFNRYNKESEGNEKLAKKNTEVFAQKTNNLFNDKFKGFEYNIGDKKFRFNVKDKEVTKKTQSDLNGFLTKFVDKNLSLTDAKGYHKSLFSAMNADAVANHFYEQGKADAMKDSVAKAKNVNMDPRQSHGTIEAGGIKVRVLGEDSSDFKFKIKQK